MAKANVVRRVVLLLGLSALAVSSLSPPAMAVSYSASGTHQCKSQDGSMHTCVVSGSYFSNCIDASRSLQARDCCRSMRTGGTSVGFTMSYCIPGR